MSVFKGLGSNFFDTYHIILQFEAYHQYINIFKEGWRGMGGVETSKIKKFDMNVVFRSFYNLQDIRVTDFSFKLTCTTW